MARNSTSYLKPRLPTKHQWPIPPSPGDPDYGLPERFHAARLAKDYKEMVACIDLADSMTSNRRDAANLLGVHGWRILAKICTRLGISSRHPKVRLK